MAAFQNLIFQLEALGVIDVLIPFFLIFTVVFAVLEKSHVLGKGDHVKRYNAILSLVMGFAVVVPHVLYGTPNPADARLINGFVDPVELINNVLPGVSIFIIAGIMLLLLLGVFGLSWPGKDDEKNGGTFVVIASMLILVYLFTTSAGLFGMGLPWWLWWLADPNTISLVVTILVFGLVVYFITRDESSKKDDDNKMFVPMRIKDNE